jgi:hypothetical protein
MSCTNRFAAAAVLCGLLAASGLATTAAAQTTATASISAIANVSGIAPLTAAGVNNLNFGAVIAGTPKVPTSMAADAGRFNISGEPNTPVTVSFALPTVLTGAGAATIPITFSSSDGLRWTAYPTTFTTFSPNSAFGTSLDGSGNLVIGIAGTVSPPTGTTTGTYTGTITLTVSY